MPRAIVYIYNKTSYNSLNYKISYKVKNKKKSILTNIKTFSSLYYYNIKEPKLKLDLKTTKEILIDYKE